MNSPQIVLGGDTYTLGKFLYYDGSIGLHLKFENHTIPITNNIQVRGRGDNEVIVRDYGDTKGIYNWLLNEGVVEKNRTIVEIGLNKAKICKLNEEWIKK